MPSDLSSEAVAFSNFPKPLHFRPLGEWSMCQRVDGLDELARVALFAIFMKFLHTSFKVSRSR